MTDMKIEILDERARALLADAHLEKLCTGATWSEGPVWIDEESALLWSDIPKNRMLRWSAEEGMTVWREKVEFTNGHTRDLNGDLLHCSHGLRAIVRTPLVGGTLQAATPDHIVVNEHAGGRLNSPNDIVVRRDGTIWFTDPPYGILSDREGHKAASEQKANYVFCFDPSTSTLLAATSEVDEPNGLAFSPDESILYVSDTSGALRKGGNHHIVAFDVDGMSLSNFRVHAVVNPGLPDGFRVDRNGWIFTSSEDAVQVISAEGELLARIPVPEKVGNLTFGGRERNELYVVASTSLYRIVLNTQGVAP